MAHKTVLPLALTSGPDHIFPERSFTVREVATSEHRATITCWPERRAHKNEVEAAVANIKSQIKRNRQTEKRNARNRQIRAELRTRTRSVLAAAEAGDDDVDEKLRLAIKRIDKAVSKGTMHKNTAARTKSRLTAKVRGLQNA